MPARTHHRGAWRALAAALMGARRAGDPGLREQLTALPRLVAAVVRGRYTGTTTSRLALMALAVGYVVSPVDLVPEAVFLLAGLVDDALVLTWLAGAVVDETTAFLRWERSGRPAADGPDAAGTDRDAEPGRETVEGSVVV